MKKSIILALIICLIIPVYFAHETDEPHEEPEENLFNWFSQHAIEAIIYGIILLVGIIIILLLVLPKFIKFTPKK